DEDAILLYIVTSYALLLCQITEAAHQGITRPIYSRPTSSPLRRQAAGRLWALLMPMTTPTRSPTWVYTVRSLAWQPVRQLMAVSGRLIRVVEPGTPEPMVGGLRRSRLTWIWSVLSVPTATFCWSRRLPTASAISV